MKLVLTQHKAIQDKDKRWQTEEFEPVPGASIKNVRWPSDPWVQPVEIVWIVGGNRVKEST